MNNNFGLPERTINEILEYFKTKKEIEKVIIFGSRTKGTYNIGSDIDFAVFTDNPNIISTVADDLYELQTPYKFDVINYNSLSNEKLKNNIDNEGKIFYEKV